MSRYSSDRSTPTSQRTKDRKHNSAQEKDAKRILKEGSHQSPGKLSKLEESGNWERYAPSEASVSLVSNASGRPRTPAQSARSGSRKNSVSSRGYGARQDGGHSSRRHGQEYIRTPIPESIPSSAVESLRGVGDGSMGNAQVAPRANSKADSKISSYVSGASDRSGRRGDSQCDNSVVSNSQHRPATAPSRSSASRTASEVPSGSYDMYGSEASSRNPTSTELAMANRMRQQRMVKTGRVFEGKTAYREGFKAPALEERISVPRGLMLHMHPEWVPAYATGRNTTTSRAHFANQAASDVRAAGSSTALEVSPLICDW